MKRKISRSSADSVTIPIASSFGSWNWSHSRSSQKARTFDLRSETVVSSSVIPDNPKVRII